MEKVREAEGRIAGPSTIHRGGTHLVGHGGGEVEVVWVVGGDPDLDAARPLLDEAVDPDLEELAVLERAVRHRHAVVELVVRPPALGGPATGFGDPKIDSNFSCRVILVVENLGGLLLLLSTAKTGW